MINTQTHVFNQSNDFRGLTAYNKKDGSSIIIMELGNIPDGYTLTVKPATPRTVYDATLDMWVEDTSPIIPASITSYQAKCVMIDYEITNADGTKTSLFNLVTQYIDSLDTSLPENMKIVVAWNAPTFERNNPTVIALATHFGLTSDNIDTLFINAAKVV